MYSTKYTKVISDSFLNFVSEIGQIIRGVAAAAAAFTSRIDVADEAAAAATVARRRRTMVPPPPLPPSEVPPFRHHSTRCSQSVNTRHSTLLNTPTLQCSS